MPPTSAQIEEALAAAAALHADDQGPTEATYQRFLRAVRPLFFAAPSEAAQVAEARFIAHLAREPKSLKAVAFWLMGMAVQESELPEAGGVVIALFAPVDPCSGECSRVAPVTDHAALGKAITAAVDDPQINVAFSPFAILADDDEPYLCELLPALRDSFEMAKEHMAAGADADPMPSEVRGSEETTAGCCYYLPGWVESHALPYGIMATRLEAIHFPPVPVQLVGSSESCSTTLARVCGASHLFAAYYRPAMRAVGERLKRLHAEPSTLWAVLAVRPTADPLLYSADLLLRHQGRSLAPVALGEIRAPLFLFVALLVAFRSAWVGLDYHYGVSGP